MIYTTLNAAEMKSYNRRLILRHLRTRNISRAELARRTGLTRAAISLIIDALQDENIVHEGFKQNGRVGRKSINIEINPRVFHAIGLNIARHSYTLGLVDFGGNLLDSHKKDLDPRKDAVDILNDIQDDLAGMTRHHVLPGRLLGLGITSPGPLDSRNGIILNPPNFPSWSCVKIAEFFASRLGCKVLLENNANALALAEKSFGINGQYDSFLELVVDSGIGAGFIQNGDLYKGSAGFGNELGHTSICFNGLSCGCGNHGCAEMYASIPNLIQAVARVNPDLNSWPVIVDMAALGDKRAKAALALEAEYLASLIVNVVNLLDVQAIVLTGDVAYRTEYLLQEIRCLVNDRFIYRGEKDLTILQSKLPENPAVLSSANLVFEDMPL
jgi:N-acetylglucosamine repressor